MSTCEWICVGCGVRFKGRELRGTVKPSNGPPADKTQLCLCRECEQEPKP